MNYKSLKGYYRPKKDSITIRDRIVVERDYKKLDTVNFFYFMCGKTGGGTMLKTQLLEEWERV
jgi:hypothetical protein